MGGKSFAQSRKPCRRQIFCFACLYRLYAGFLDEIRSVEIGLSRGRLLTLYHQQTGRTIGKTLLDIRLGEAKRRLAESGEESIERICYLSGFTDLANFYKYFRRETGMTPGDYRASARRAGAEPPAGSVSGE